MDFAFAGQRTTPAYGLSLHWAECRPIEGRVHIRSLRQPSRGLAVPTMDSTFAGQGLYLHPSRTLPSQARDSAFTRFGPLNNFINGLHTYPEDSACTI